MSLVETLVAGGLLALVLWVMSGLYGQMLDRARTRQTTALLRSLDAALAAYRDADGHHPLGRSDGSADDALLVMVQVPESLEVLRNIDRKLLRTRDSRPLCRDPWGRRLRYICSRTRDADLQARLVRHGGAPIFESAGPDGIFGHAGNAAAADDIRSDDPGV